MYAGVVRYRKAHLYAYTHINAKRQVRKFEYKCPTVNRWLVEIGQGLSTKNGKKIRQEGRFLAFN